MKINNLLNPTDYLDPPRSNRGELKKDDLYLEMKSPSLPVNFWPYDTSSDPTLEREYAKHGMWPRRNVQTWTDSIPYNGHDFKSKTGRCEFKVFGYEFVVPENEPQAAKNGRNHVWKEVYSIIWDYQIGLVRMTTMFKACKYGQIDKKTTPNKVIQSNPGLESVTHSVTGGAIKAQGYWMPYEAAKAVAATFAWPIRYMLTPIFGPGFPDMCIEPTSLIDPPDFRIDPGIIDRCQKDQKAWLSLPDSFGRLLPSLKRAKRATRNSPGARRTSGRDTRRSVSKGLIKDSERIQAGNQFGSNSSLPTPSSTYQSPTQAVRHETESNAPSIPSPNEIPSPKHTYLSPSSLENDQRELTYSPDISPRTVIRKTHHPSQYPSPNSDKVKLDPHLTGKELETIEGLLCMAYGPEKARKMMPSPSPPAEERPITALGLIMPKPTAPGHYLSSSPYIPASDPIYSKTTTRSNRRARTNTLLSPINEQSFSAIHQVDADSQRTTSPPSSSLTGDVTWAATKLLDIGDSSGKGAAAAAVVAAATETGEREAPIRQQSLLRPRAQSHPAPLPLSGLFGIPVRRMPRSASVAFPQQQWQQRLLREDEEDDNDNGEEEEEESKVGRRPTKRVRRSLRLGLANEGSEKC